MSELNLQNQGPRKNQNKKPPGRGSMAMLIFKVAVLGFVLTFFVSTMFGQGHDPRNQGDPVPADYKASESQPARAVDDGLGTLIIFPPTMQYRADAVDEGMKQAKDIWKKAHPERIVVAVLDNKGGPLDYGYRWVIFYEIR